MCITCEYVSTAMNESTWTVPYSQTRPRSLRPRSTSITCSARSFSSASRPSAILASSAWSAPRGRVPAIGRVDTWRSDTVSSGSGVPPPVPKATKAEKYMYGARARDPEVHEVEEVHVRARVHDAQPAVDRERIGVEVGAPALGRHDLEGVAGVHVLDDARDHRLELLARHVRGELGAVLRGRRRRRRQRAGEQLLGLGDRVDRRRVGAVDVGLGVVGVDV